MNKKVSLYGNEEKDRLENYFPDAILQQTSHLLTEMKFIILNASLWRCQTPWHVPERRITDNLVMIPIEGEYAVTVGQESATIRRGEAVFIPEGAPHTYGFAPDCNQGSNFILHALPLYPSATSPFQGFSSPFQRLSHPEAVLEQLYRGVALRNHNESAAFTYIGGILQHLLIDAMVNGNYHCDNMAASDSRIKTAYRFINDNFTANLSINDIATIAGLKEVQFRRIFRRETNLLPNEYIHRLRLMHAVRLLLRYNYKLERIATESGFHSTSYFCSSFQRFFKMTPESFRQKHR